MVLARVPWIFNTSHPPSPIRPRRRSPEARPKNKAPNKMHDRASVLLRPALFPTPGKGATPTRQAKQRTLINIHNLALLTLLACPKRWCSIPQCIEAPLQTQGQFSLQEPSPCPTLVQHLPARVVSELEPLGTKQGREGPGSTATECFERFEVSRRFHSRLLALPSNSAGRRMGGGPAGLLASRLVERTWTW